MHGSGVASVGLVQTGTWTPLRNTSTWFGCSEPISEESMLNVTTYGALTLVATGPLSAICLLNRTKPVGGIPTGCESASRSPTRRPER